MDQELIEQRLKALKDLESCIDQIDPKTFDRDRSLQEIAQALEEQNDHLQSLTEMVRNLTVILAIPEKERWNLDVQKNYYEHMKQMFQD